MTVLLRLELLDAWYSPMEMTSNPSQLSLVGWAASSRTRQQGKVLNTSLFLPPHETQRFSNQEGFLLKVEVPDGDTIFALLIAFTDRNIATQTYMESYQAALPEEGCRHAPLHWSRRTTGCNLSESANLPIEETFSEAGSISAQGKRAYCLNLRLPAMGPSVEEKDWDFAGSGAGSDVFPLTYKYRVRYRVTRTVD